jgi:hypothetical protein
MRRFLARASEGLDPLEGFLHNAFSGDPKVLAEIALVATGGPVSFDKPAEDALTRFIDGDTLSADDFAAMGEDKARDAVARLIAFGAAEAV